MVFILGVNYPERMLVRNMLTKLYGISQTSSTWYIRAPETYTPEKAPASVPSAVAPLGSFTSSRTTPLEDTSPSSSTSSPNSPSSSTPPTNSSPATEPQRNRNRNQNQQKQNQIPEATKLPEPSARRHNLLSRIMAKHHIHRQQTLGALSHAQVQDLSLDLSELTLENDLRRKVRDDIKRLHDIQSFRGRRHLLGLPARGQRSRTQTSTVMKLNKLERHG